VAARPAAGAYRTDPYPADPRPAYWRLEGLRTALTIVGLIALIAVGLAVWALIRSDHNRRATNGAPANAAAMVALTSRVDRLEASVRSLSSSKATRPGNTGSLGARVAALQQGEQRLTSQLSHAANPAQVSQLAGKEAALSGKVSQLTGKEAALSGQVSQLQGRVAQLAGQISQLNRQTPSQTTSTGTSTIP
jgi:chromosome segregation ATPase